MKIRSVKLACDNKPVKFICKNVEIDGLLANHKLEKIKLPKLTRKNKVP